MCDIADSNRCMAALSPQMDTITQEIPGGGVFAYIDENDTICGDRDKSFAKAEKRFKALPVATQSRGVLLHIPEQDVSMLL